MTILSLGEACKVSLTALETLEMTLITAVGCGWSMAVFGGDTTGLGGAQLVSMIMNARSRKKSAATALQKGPRLPGFLVVDGNTYAPFKNTIFMIKSISYPLHNADTDMNTDIEVPGGICLNQYPLEHGYARSVAHST